MLRLFLLAGLMTGAAGTLRAEDQPAARPFTPTGPTSPLAPPQANPVPLPEPDAAAPGLFPTAAPQQTPNPLVARRLYDQDLQTIRWSMPLPFDPTDGSLLASPNPSDDSLAGGRWPRNLFSYTIGKNTEVRADGVVRGYYSNDQRIEWSGLESSFGAEGVIRPSIRTTCGNWVLSAAGEFFINQPYNDTLLNNAELTKYQDNFKVDPFQIFQLYVEAQYDDFSVRVGKSRTPFGRYQSPMFTNKMLDAPFLRTDVIQFVETGIFFHYQPGGLVVDAALVNGEPNLDTNSSKGGVGRIGYEGPFWTAGVSAKVQDGISSEHQKLYNNVYGVDASVRAGRLLFYGEAMYDEHGFVRDFWAFNVPFSGSFSMYGRDAFSGTVQKPITGYGYYAGAAYHWDAFLLDLSFGSYWPQPIGDPASDTPIHRGIIKGVYSITGSLQAYAVALVENRRPVPGVVLNPSAYPYAVFTGLQFGF